MFCRRRAWFLAPPQVLFRMRARLRVRVCEVCSPWIGQQQNVMESSFAGPAGAVVIYLV